mgnify:CR=1 FL=1
MREEEINNLIVKYMDSKATENEVKLIDAWYKTFDTKKGIISQMSALELDEAVNKGFETFKNRLFPKS